MFDEKPFEDVIKGIEIRPVSLVAKHIPILLCLDISGSMRFNNKINMLNKGVQRFCLELLDHPNADGIELALMTFDYKQNLYYPSGKRDDPFASLSEFAHDIPVVHATEFVTYLGTAILKAVDVLQEKKDEYRRGNFQYKQPTLILFTDGRPEGEKANKMDEAIRLCQEKEQEAWNIVVVAIDIDKNYIACLNQITNPAVNGGHVIECEDAADIVKQLVFASKSIDAAIRNPRNLRSHIIDIPD